MESLLERLSTSYAQKSLRHKARKSRTKLYERLHNLIKDGIINNDIPPQSLLPPTRTLAEALSLSRSTVVKAYELLRLEGYIYSQVGSGYTVKRLHKANAILEPEPNAYPNISERGQAFEKNINLINSTDDQSIAFRPGLPPLDVFPVNHWKNLSNLYWRHIKSSALSYSPASGIEQLKKNVAHYLNLSRGIKCDYRQIVIVSGSLQSLYLLGTALVNPGDGVVMENPTFPNVHSIFKGLGAKINAVGVDLEGLETHLLPQESPSIKLVHCTPACHYPSGTVMSAKRKEALLNWAAKNKAFIIENDYEHEIHNYKNQAPAIYSLDTQQRTVYLGTFNRILHPSIRLGYMVLPPYLIKPVEAILQHSHRFVPTSIQVVLNQFIENNHLYKHIKNVWQAAKERLSLFEKVFEEEFGSSLKLTQSEAPSLHTLALLPAGLSDTAVVKRMAEHNIICHAYSKCFVGQASAQGLILGYASVRPPILKRKLKEMALIYKQLFKIGP